MTVDRHLHRPGLKWLKRIALTLAGLLLLYVIIGLWVLPPLLKPRLEKQLSNMLGRRVSIAAIRFHPFGLSAEASDLAIYETEGEPFAGFEALFADVQLTSLIRWAFVFREIRIQAPYGVLKLLPEGRMNIDDMVVKLGESESEPEKKPEWPRAVVERFQVVDGKATVEDLRGEAPIREVAAPIGFTIENLSTLKGRQGEYRLAGKGPGGERFDITGQLSVDPVRVQGHYSMEGVPLNRYWAHFLLAAVILGCGHVSDMPPAYDSRGPAPLMPALEMGGPNLRPAPIFGFRQEFVGSPLEEVGREGLFQAHGPIDNRIALLTNGEASLAARMALLENAETSIRIQVFIFAGDESGLHIADVLKRKKAAGLDVRVIVDAPSNLGLQTQWMYFDLKQHGIEVQGYESLYLEWLNEVPIPFLSPDVDTEAPNHRYHEKLWIVDGETGGGSAVAGGLNIANDYFRVDISDPGRLWRDQDIIVKGPIVADMVTAFDRNFDHFSDIKKSRGILNTDLYWQGTRQLLGATGRLTVPYRRRPELDERIQEMIRTKPALAFEYTRARFFHQRPRLGETYLEQAYRKLIDHAEQEILICNAYFIPSAEFAAALRAAVGRGVRVRILTNSPETNNHPEVTLVGRSRYPALLAMNEADSADDRSGGDIHIWEWTGRRYDQARRTEGTLHAKYAVFDRRFSLVGSYNLDPRSEKLNSETAVVFESETLSTGLAKIFYENDLAYSRPITPADATAFQTPEDALYKLRKEFGTLFESQL